MAMHYAKIFNAPFTIISKTITKSYRDTCAKQGKPVLLFEGGKSKTVIRSWPNMAWKV